MPELIGYGCMVVAAMLVVFAALCLMSWLIGLAAKEVFHRLLRTYHLEVIGYYLRRLEKEGNVFRKPS